MWRLGTLKTDYCCKVSSDELGPGSSQQVCVTSITDIKRAMHVTHPLEVERIPVLLAALFPRRPVDNGIDSPPLASTGTDTTDVRRTPNSIELSSTPFASAAKSRLASAAPPVCACLTSPRTHTTASLLELDVCFRLTRMDFPENSTLASWHSIYTRRHEKPYDAGQIVKSHGRRPRKW